MLITLNGFQPERPACRPWSLVPLLCIFIGLLTLIGIAFLARYIYKNKKEKLLNGIILIYGLLFLWVLYLPVPPLRQKRTVRVIKPYPKRLRLPLKSLTAWTRAHIQSAPFILIITEACWQATR